MRTLTASLALLLTGLTLTNCGSDKKADDGKTLINTSFDEFQGWIDNSSGTLSNKVAHSGRYSITVGGGKEYGLTFKSPLGQMIAAKPRKLALEGWVRTEEANTPAQLVVQVTKPGTDEKVFWKGISLAEGTKPGEWTELNMNLDLPDNVASDQVLGVYLWGNNAGKPVYLDDLRITNAD
ncbi:hypothetical protein [Hymenobacter chitinivorans]|uniref:Carbohydrate binding protein n=1 Tax=Hymenobacter chitinivorans DSM 11115 TaxID=1121954 RepID=A0A2M9AS06_9BACT|nr:hypothetical protein [Hymenobacter chitinivorans]PJJ48481.1 hypothetical protein CLV45_4189 [Hymenobacter chitinivorans DSM 11115]